ncbi:MAG TPA: thioredoxin domain-containing protein [Rhodanobacteraceae bacterium]|nr:thioredoxin domain-containing protein [Rhodanobacteraceae bacterium]
MTTSAFHAAPLNWGHGANAFEIFIEPTCPFCAKVIGKFEALLATVDPDAVTVKLRLHSQPWHLFSGVATRCVLAASTLDHGRDRAWDVLKAIKEHREEFVLEHHATGTARERSVNGTLALIERYSGIKLADAFAQPELEGLMSWHAKYSRQNGIHVSPTFMVNGIVAPKLGSGDPIETWIAAIRDAAGNAY